jgi:hypothetical protein
MKHPQSHTDNTETTETATPHTLWCNNDLTVQPTYKGMWTTNHCPS